MKLEFERYGLGRYRTLTGFLELLGGLGIILGLKFKELYFLSTLGLTLLMFLGIIARLRVKDKFISILPAIIYFFLNLYLFINQMSWQMFLSE